MPAIVFNHVSAARWGATPLDRIYNGATLVWPVAGALPLHFDWRLAATAIPPSAAFAVTAGSWKSAAVGPSATRAALGASSGVISTAQAVGVNAANVRISANVWTGGTGWCVMQARVGGGNSYQADYQTLGSHSTIRLLRNGSVLATRDITALTTADLIFSVVGSTLTLARGSSSITATDATISGPGAVAIGASLNCGFHELTIENA